MPEPTVPNTHKGQLDNILSTLGVPDFAAAQVAIGNFATQQAEWNGQRQALFNAIGGTGNVPEHYDFAASLTALRNEQQALFTALGVTSQAEAVPALTNLRSQVNSLNANQTTMFAALGATDLAGAMRAIKDIDGRVEAGINAGVIARAAAAGVPAPVPKVPGEGGTQGGAKTCTRAEWGQMNAKQQLEFSSAGGKIVEATA